jgi:hypothetical protein
LRAPTDTEDPFPLRRPGSAIYGTILTGSVITVEGASDDADISRLAALVVATQCVYWLAHVYAEIIGARIATGQRASMGEARRVLRDEWPIVTASFGPLTVLVLTQALGADVNEAALSALGANAVVLAGWTLLAGCRARLRWTELILYVAVSSAFGLALVLLKVLVR